MIVRADGSRVACRLRTQPTDPPASCCYAATLPQPRAPLDDYEDPLDRKRDFHWRGRALRGPNGVALAEVIAREILGKRRRRASDLSCEAGGLLGVAPRNQ